MRNQGLEAEKLVEMTPNEIFSLPPLDVEAIRLRLVQQRFDSLRPKVAVLDRLATNQTMDSIDKLDDAVPLLFQHTVYKSYPLSLLENGRFDRLTKWLDALTSHDLSGFDASTCTSIDEWLARLDAETPMRLVHTSGTGGKLSFLPRSVAEALPFENAWYQHHQPFGDEQPVPLKGTGMPLLAFGYRHGYNASQRRFEALVKNVSGSEDRCLALFPVRLSADLLSLAGRLAAAEANGEPADARITPSLLARRDEFLTMQRDRSKYARDFVIEAAERFRGERVVMTGTLSAYLDVMTQAEALGLSNLFAPTSVITAGGGFKGRTDIPADWEPRLNAVLGLTEIPFTYGMTELMAYMKACPNGNFHLPPYVLPYVLDPDDSTPSPRTGVSTGRFAFVDLLASSYWGGFITGDKITMHWDDPCGCGRLGCWIEPVIERYSALRGGDDKISCARVGDAHEQALEYLLSAI
jgi:hypothetical protein